jgi:cephalosporin hydroxylase
MDIRWHLKLLSVKLAIKLLKSTGWYEGYWNHWRGEVFDYSERQGLHIMPVHYYTPIPDVNKLSPKIWEPRKAITKINIDLNKSLEFLENLLSKYYSEYQIFSYKKQSDKEFYLGNAAYGSGDAEVLYSMIRELKPKKIIEIGAGYSTLLIAKAISKNLHENSDSITEFISIEPYPPSYLQPPPNECSKFLSSELQEVPLTEFESLKQNDILFIDSSHVVNINSDVVYEYLEILPCLKSGVLIHIHDIFLPNEYPQDWLQESRFFWNEQYLLHAFLLFNREFEVIIPLNLLAQEYRENIEKIIPSCKKYSARPSSLWLRKL